jgi:basic amino acid/polyamine antiporter, APA family
MSAQVQGRSAEPTETHVFARDSTGLVREVGPVSSAIYNLSYSSAPLSIALMLSLAPAAYLGGNMFLATLFTLLLALPTAFVFAMFTTAIPRSGGDYTWISRSISPMLGFASNFSFMVWAVFIIGVYGTLVPSSALAPLFRFIAAEFNAPGALKVSTFLTEQAGTLIVGTLLVVGGAAVLIFSRGVRSYIRVQNIFFGVWAFCLLMLVPVIMLLTSKGSFAGHFDSYVKALGGPAHAAKAVTASGIPHPGFSLKESILLVTIPYYALGFIYQSAYLAGETKRGSKGVLMAMPGAQIISAVFFCLLIAAFLTSPGRSFLAGLSINLGHYGLEPGPQYPELAAIASGSTVIGLIIMLANVLFYVIWVPLSIIMISRSIFAWSFDRLIPEKASAVNSRTHSPVNAVLMIAVVCIGAVVLVALEPKLGALVVLLGQTLTFVCVGLAAMVFPYRQAAVFAASPFNRRIGGLPLISVLGGLSAACMIGMMIILLEDPNSGTAWSTNPGRVITCAIIFGGGLIIYQAIRMFQRMRGVDIDLAYREIPPE